MNMPSPSPSPLTPELLERLHGAGLRLTVATRAVLGLLAGAAQSSPSHFEVLAQLKARGVAIDRVTLYRLLDRLAACGLLQRHPDPHERRWRFTWVGATRTPAAMALPSAQSTRCAPAPQTALQPHFECDSCHQLLPLPLAQGQTASPSHTPTQTSSPNPCTPQLQTRLQTQLEVQAQALAQNWSAALAALGHRAQRLDLTLHGTCASCSHSANQAT